MDASSIKVSVNVLASIKDVWSFWTSPEDICQWNNASDDWETTKASNDLRSGGKFSYFMSAKDKSVGFDFNGVYTLVEPYKLIEYTIQGGRKVSVSFEIIDGATRITETFEPENINTHELQQSGWQSILNNFKKYVEQSNKRGE